MNETSPWMEKISPESWASDKPRITRRKPDILQELAVMAVLSRVS